VIRITALLLGLVACDATPPVPGGTLLWVSDQGDRVVTWAMGDDGRPTQLVHPDGALYPAQPDPRGTHALLVSAHDGAQGHQERLWLAPLDGTTRRPLSPYSNRIRNPDWSADGDFIVFESDARSFRDLYRVDREGGEPIRLTHTRYGSFEPAISPDSTRVAFGSSRDGNAEIYAMDLDGAHPVRLTHGPGDDLRPRWHPDGQTLAWLSTRDGVRSVWRMNADGLDARPLRPPEGTHVDIDFAWSPDGSRIAVVVQTGPDQLEVQVRSHTGALITRLDGPGVDEHPAWSPDGRWLAWSATDSAGRPLVALASLDTGVVHRGGSASGWLPRWVPPPT